MVVNLNLPNDLATRLTPEGGDLGRVALEALALEGYRSRVLFESDLVRMLGFESRLDVHAFLKEHGVYLQYDVAEFERDEATALAQRPEVEREIATH
jgi:hypothetical protein